jgi:hypothetical protein
MPSSTPASTLSYFGTPSASSRRRISARSGASTRTGAASPPLYFLAFILEVKHEVMELGADSETVRGIDVRSRSEQISPSH